MPRSPLARLLLAATLAFAGTAAHAGIDVRIEGVDDEIEANVRAFLSLQRYAGMRDLDAATVERLGQRAERETRAALRPFGHYQPTVTATLRPDGKDWRAVVRIEPGPVVTLVAADVAVTGPGKDEAFFRDALAASRLRPGAPLRHADYEAIKGDLQRLAAAHGYLDAALTRAELAVDVGRREARAALELATGERYRFGATAIEQDVVAPALVARFLRWHEGDWYEAAALLRTQFALDDSEYFGLVEVLPGERDRAARSVPVRIHAEPGHRNRYSVAAGYATDTRFRGTLGWKNRRYNDRGHRLGSELQVSQLQQEARLSYVIPWDDPALEKLSFELAGGRAQYGDLETSGGSLRAGLTQVRGNWQRVLFTTAAVTASDTGVSTAAAGSGTATRVRDQLLVPGISYASLPRTISGAGQTGRSFYAELLGSHSALGSGSDFARLRVQGEHRLDFGARWHVLLRGQLGVSAVRSFAALPADYRFFAGGDRSVRGYGLDELSPVNADGERIGGRHLLVASAEIERDLPRNFALAVFVDGGNAFDRFGDPLAYSAGLGVRWKLPFVSVGVDVAQSLSDTSRGPRLHLNISPVL